MGRPAAPLPLLLLLLLLRAATGTASTSIRASPAAPPAPCFDIPPGNASALDLTNRTASCAELDWAPFAARRVVRLAHNGIAALAASARAGEALELLDLSHNRLRRLPAAFLSRAPRLRELFLQRNELRELPSSFFSGAPALRILRLDGNPLRALPALPAGLQSLRLPCRCALLRACACRAPDCTAPACLCRDDGGGADRNGTEFQRLHCGGAGVAGAVGAGVAAALLVLAAAAGVAVLRRRRRAAVSGCRGKRDPAGAAGQPRYVSRAAEPPGACAAPDYENVFVSPAGAAALSSWTPAQGRPQTPPDDDYFLESEGSGGEQPIYANAPGPGGGDDDVYVVPDK